MSEEAARNLWYDQQHAQYWRQHSAASAQHQAASAQMPQPMVRILHALIVLVKFDAEPWLQSRHFRAKYLETGADAQML